MNETLRAVARACYGVTVWLHRMWCSQCVSNRLLWRLFLCMGRCEKLLQERSRSLPSLRGSTSAVATPYKFRPPRRMCRDGPEHFGPTYLAFLGSRGAGCVRPSHARLLALLNVSAADELQHSTEVLRLPLSELRRKFMLLARVHERVASLDGGATNLIKRQRC